MPESLQGIYKRLYDHFGPQGWWPTTPPGKTRPRYYPGKIRHLSAGEQWEIVVGAVLTQNTAWRNVELALANLSERRFLHLQTFCTLAEAELAALIRPSGCYNQKARRLQQIARYIAGKQAITPGAKDSDSRRTALSLSTIANGSITSILSQPAAPLRRELLDLPGIGPETADSILLYAAGHPFFVIDAYTRRILSRLGLIRPDLSYTELQTIFMDQLSPDPDLFNEYHALLVRHATTYCRAKPLCGECCLNKLCIYSENT